MSTEDNNIEEQLQEERTYHVADLNNATLFALNMTNLLHGALLKALNGERVEADLAAMEHYARASHYSLQWALNKVHTDLTQSTDCIDNEIADNGATTIH